MLGYILANTDATMRSPHTFVCVSMTEIVIHVDLFNLETG